MLMKIVSVFPQVRNWGDAYPENCSVGVMFEDGSQGEVGTKKTSADSVKQKLQALVGQEAEFELERKKDYQGIPQYKIVSYPGKQESGGRGGGGFQSAWRNTEDGFKFEQEQMMRRTALMQSVLYFSESPSTKATPEDVTGLAGVLYSWLMAPQNSQNPTKASEPQNRQESPQGLNNGQKNGIWEGPGQCPKCHCPPGKLHGNVCREE